MITRPQPTRLQRFLTISPPPVDDRGQRIRPREGEVLGTLEARLLGRRRILGRLLVFVPIIVIVGYNLTRAALSAPGAGFARTLPILTVVGVIVGFAILTQLATRKSAAIRTGATQVSATSAAMGHCGVCGYELGDIPPAEDGCVACPECGAAWHIERRTLVGVDPALLGEMVKKIPQQRNGGFGFADDRGVALLSGTAYTWPRPTFSSALPGSAAPAIALYRRYRRTFRWWCLGIAGLVWCLVVIIAGLSTMNVPDTAHTALIAAVVLLLIALLIPFVSLPPSKVRSLALKAARCPSCYGVLDASLARFDGCTVCAGCRASWNAGDIDTASVSRADAGVNEVERSSLPSRGNS